MGSQITALFSQSGVDVPLVAYQLENCEVAKVESTMSANKPTITFNRLQIYVNVELIKCVPEMVYAQFLIDRAVKKLILRPCDKRERDAVRLRTLSEAAAKPRHILAVEFSGHLFEYMEWDANYRYKVSGNIINSNGETLVVFDLTAAERFKLPAKDEIVPQKPDESYPQQDGSFGATVREHHANPLVAQFAEDTVIPIENRDNETELANGSDKSGMSAPEVMAQ